METIKKVIYKVLAGIVFVLSVLTFYRAIKKPSTVVKTVDDSIQKDHAEKIEEQETTLKESQTKLEEVARPTTEKLPDEFVDRIEKWNKGN